jgi:hypothetical protein
MDGTEPAKYTGIDVPQEERTPLVDRLLPGDRAVADEARALLARLDHLCANLFSC